MRTWWSVVVKELREAYHGGKMWAGLLLVLLITPLTTAALLQQHEERFHEFESRRSLLDFPVSTGRPYSDLKFHVLREPSVYTLFNAGIEGDFPYQYSLPRWTFVDPTSAQVFDRPLFSVLPTRDLRFVFEMVLPLLGVVLSFALIAGEREAGTLPLLCSHAVYRSTLLLGKVGAGALVLLVLVAVAHLAVTVVLLMWGVPWPRDFPSFLALHFLASALWSLFFFLAGVLASVWVTESNQAAIAMLVVWASIVVVVPTLLPSVVTSASRYVSEQEVYENTWPVMTPFFEAYDEFLDGLDVASPRGLARFFALEPVWSDVAAALARPGSGMRVLVHSQGVVAISGADEEQFRMLEERLPRLLETQMNVGRAVFELRWRRFEALREEWERFVRWFSWLPVVAFDALTARLAETDAEAFQDFVVEANLQKTEFFEEMEGRTDFYTRRYFTDVSSGQDVEGVSRPPLWVAEPRRGSTWPRCTEAWLVLCGEDLLILLAALALFARREVI